MYSFKGKNRIFLGLKMILVLFSVVIIFSIFYSTYLNVKFAKNMDYDKTLGKAKYILEENGYIFKYKNAYPWSFNCFASVCTEESMKMYVDEKGNMTTNGMTMILFIWPELDGYKYGVDMYKEDNERVDLQIYIDDELNLVTLDHEQILDEDLEKEAKELLEQYHKEIEELMEVAKEKWRID